MDEIDKFIRRRKDEMVDTRQVELNDAGIALIGALREKDILTARQLLKQPLNVNAIDSREVTALMVAAYRGYADICEELLRLGADVQYEIKYYVPCGDEDFEEEELEFDSVSGRAKCSGDELTINVIGKAFVNAEWITIKDNLSFFGDYGSECLINAARFGMTSICVEMISAGIAIDGTGYLEDSAVAVAVDNGNMETCFVLLALGANSESLRCNEKFPRNFHTSFESVRKYFL